MRCFYHGRLHSPQPGRASVTALLAVISLFVSVTPINASSRNDLVVAAGATTAEAVTALPAGRFLDGFVVVCLRVKQHELSDYTASAVRLRPDLSARIVTAAIAAARRNAATKQAEVCVTVEKIIRAAIAANPAAAVSIASAACEAFKSLRSCITAAAISAAPDQKLAILEAIAGSSVLAAWSHHSSEESGGFFGGSGSISPANFSDIGSHVNSPEQAGP